ncbi:MAG: hypothetical protein ACKOGG_06650 [Actinomycetota bacterium]
MARSSTFVHDAMSVAAQVNNNQVEPSFRTGRCVVEVECVALARRWRGVSSL